MAIVPDVDRERLRQVATNFRTALRSKFGDGLMTFVPRLNLQQDACDGWGVEIATMGDGFPNVEIFLNRYLGGIGRRLWAGLYSPTETIIQEVIDSYPLPIGRAVTDEDWEDEPLRLTIPFTADEVKYPHPESFKAAGLFYFGIYDLDGKPDDADFLARAVDFIRALPDFQDSSEIGLDFRALEGMTVEQRRLV